MAGRIPPWGTAAPPVMVAGEALIDLVADADGRLVAHPGGGPFNAARTVARLGRPAAFLGRLSDDRFGARLEHELASDGVQLGGVVRTTDPTTLALAEVDPAGVARYRFYDQGTSAAGLAPAEALRALTVAPSLLHVGSLGLVLEPIATALLAVVEAVAHDVTVVVDPNCRPAAIRDPAAYRARLGRILRRADVVKVSEEDLEWLSPGSEALDAARALLREGPAAVLLTRGPDGVRVLAEGRETTVPSPPVTVVDTIGAGDAFGGGFAAWWHERGLARASVVDHDAVADGARFAALVAARTCERAGASPPRRDQLGDAA